MVRTALAPTARRGCHSVSTDFDSFSAHSRSLPKFIIRPLAQTWQHAPSCCLSDLKCGHVGIYLFFSARFPPPFLPSTWFDTSILPACLLFSGSPSTYTPITPKSVSSAATSTTTLTPPHPPTIRLFLSSYYYYRLSYDFRELRKYNTSYYSLAFFSSASIANQQKTTETRATRRSPIDIHDIRH